MSFLSCFFLSCLVFSPVLSCLLFLVSCCLVVSYLGPRRRRTRWWCEPLSAADTTGFVIVHSCLVSSCRVLSCLVLSCRVVSCRVLSCLVLSCSALSCPVLPCPALPCPVLSCPAPSCPVLSCLVLSCPALSCPFLSSNVFCYLLSVLFRFDLF